MLAERALKEPDIFTELIQSTLADSRKRLIAGYIWRESAWLRLKISWSTERKTARSFIEKAFENCSSIAQNVKIVPERNPNAQKARLHRFKMPFIAGFDLRKRLRIFLLRFEGQSSILKMY
ncbi:MAG: hypothetical protein LBU36_08565 [Clostridiales bacterium]|nr:hypothetical protein [Clostridiales bacterium]